MPSISPQNQTSRFKIAIISEENIATTSIYLAVQTSYNSAKPLGAALKKPRFLLRLQSLERTIFLLSCYQNLANCTDCRISCVADRNACSGVPQACGWTNYCERSTLIEITKGFDRRHATLVVSGSFGSCGVKIAESLLSGNLMLPNFLFRNQPSRFISILNLVLSSNVLQNKGLIKFIFNSASFCFTFVAV